MGPCELTAVLTLSSRALNCTVTAQSCFVMGSGEMADAQVWERKWTLERPRFTAEHSGICVESGSAISSACSLVAYPLRCAEESSDRQRVPR